MIGDTIGNAIVAKLSVQLAEIPDEGLDLADKVLPDELGLTSEEAQISGPLSLSAHLTQLGSHVHVDGVIDGTFVRECVRCLNPYEAYTEVPFQAEYRMPDPAIKNRERSLRGRHQASDDPADAETADRNDEVYEGVGDRVELAEMLREHIILATPMQPLCHEQCRGLCPVCGRNRNEQACGCREQPQKNPFAILQERWKKSK